MPEPTGNHRPQREPTPQDFLPPQPQQKQSQQKTQPQATSADAKSSAARPAKPAARKPAVRQPAPRSAASPQPAPTAQAGLPQGIPLAADAPAPIAAAPVVSTPPQAAPQPSTPQHAGLRVAAPLESAAASASASAPAAPGVPLVVANNTSTTQRYKARKSQGGSLLLFALGGALALVVVVGLGYFLLSRQSDESVVQGPSGDATVVGEQPATPTTPPNDSPDVDGPAPSQPTDNPAATAEHNLAPAIAQLLRAKGRPASLQGDRQAQGAGRSLQAIDADGETLEVLEFDSPLAATRSAAQLDALLAEFDRTGHVYRHAAAIVFYEGRDPRLLAQLEQTLGAPIHAPAGMAVAMNDSGGPLDNAGPFDAPATTTPPATPGESNNGQTNNGRTDVDQATTGQTTNDAPATSAEQEAENQQILQLFADGQLTSTKHYETLRGIMAARFERRHRAEIEAAFDDDFTQWLDEHRDIKEEFFTALDPQADNIPGALALFATLWRNHPEKLADNWNAAVAVAVTWDIERRNIEEFGHHQRRCSAILPSGLVGAAENFSYLLDTDSARYLPWEFLCYVVNHRTPIDERKWAVANYLPKRLMIGKCYEEVQYDTVMLQTQSRVCRLNGQDYTLPNILKFGGVCAMQADFASRVGKSLGIPSAYVHGPSNSGDMHAWVEWVVLKSVGPQKIVFSLESHGRYRGDKYYVGHLWHPQTGAELTDRQMELELHTVGMDQVAKRHARHVMNCWPMVRQQAEVPVGGQFAFLADVTKLCPGNTDAWRGMAAISREGQVDAKSRKLALKALDDLFRTFANFPDFTWTMFDDMIAFEPELKKRIGLYQRLVGMYVAAQRPDLAAQARLKLTDMLLNDGQFNAAGNGLVQTLLAFADDGRYVPPMLDKLEELCKNDKQGAAIYDAFWPAFLRNVPKYRGDTPTQHALQMHQRAIQWFESRGNAAAVQQLQLEIAKIQSGNAR